MGAGTRAPVATGALLVGALALGGCVVPGGRGASAGAPPADPAPADPPAIDVDVTGVIGTVGRLVDGAQRTASDRFDAFMLDLDDFFAGDTRTDESNTSYVRVRLDAVSPAVGDAELDPSVKLRAVLPRSERRVRFLFTTEEDPGAAGERIGEGVNVTDASDNESVSFALRFVRGARRAGDTSLDLGARQRDGRLQIFTRVRLELDRRFARRWTARAVNRWYYYYLSGYENQLRLDLSRPLRSGRDRFFRSTTTFDWRRGRQGASIGQTFGAYAELSPRTALAAELLARYDTSPREGASDRYRGVEARLRLRRNVWRPWFFYELWPSVSWPAETDYRRVWHGLARIEVTIGGQYRELPGERAPDAAPVAPGASARSEAVPANGAPQDGTGGDDP